MESAWHDMVEAACDPGEIPGDFSAESHYKPGRAPKNKGKSRTMDPKQSARQLKKSKEQRSKARKPSAQGNQLKQEYQNAIMQPDTPATHGRASHAVTGRVRQHNIQRGLVQWQRILLTTGWVDQEHLGDPAIYCASLPRSISGSDVERLSQYGSMILAQSTRQACATSCDSRRASSVLGDSQVLTTTASATQSLLSESIFLAGTSEAASRLPAQSSHRSAHASYSGSTRALSAPSREVLSASNSRRSSTGGQVQGKPALQSVTRANPTAQRSRPAPAKAEAPERSQQKNRFELLQRLGELDELPQSQPKKKKRAKTKHAPARVEEQQQLKLPHIEASDLELALPDRAQEEETASQQPAQEEAGREPASPGTEPSATARATISSAIDSAGLDDIDATTKMCMNRHLQSSSSTGNEESTVAMPMGGQQVDVNEAEALRSIPINELEVVQLLDVERVRVSVESATGEAKAGGLAAAPLRPLDIATDGAGARAHGGTTDVSNPFEVLATLGEDGAAKNKAQTRPTRAQRRKRAGRRAASLSRTTSNASVSASQRDGASLAGASHPSAEVGDIAADIGAPMPHAAAHDAALAVSIPSSTRHSSLEGAAVVVPTRSQDRDRAPAAAAVAPGSVTGVPGTEPAQLTEPELLAAASAQAAAAPAASKHRADAAPAPAAQESSEASRNEAGLSQPARRAADGSPPRDQPTTTDATSRAAPLLLCAAPAASVDAQQSDTASLSRRSTAGPAASRQGAASSAAASRTVNTAPAAPAAPVPAAPATSSQTPARESVEAANKVLGFRGFRTKRVLPENVQRAHKVAPDLFADDHDMSDASTERSASPRSVAVHRPFPSRDPAPSAPNTFALLREGVKQIKTMSGIKPTKKKSMGGSARPAPAQWQQAATGRGRGAHSMQASVLRTSSDTPPPAMLAPKPPPGAPTGAQAAAASPICSCPMGGPPLIRTPPGGPSSVTASASTSASSMSVPKPQATETPSTLWGAFRGNVPPPAPRVTFKSALSKSILTVELSSGRAVSLTPCAEEPELEPSSPASPATDPDQYESSSALGPIVEDREATPVPFSGLGGLSPPASVAANVGATFSSVSEAQAIPRQATTRTRISSGSPTSIHVEAPSSSAFGSLIDSRSTLRLADTLDTTSARNLAVVQGSSPPSPGRLDRSLPRPRSTEDPEDLLPPAAATAPSTDQSSASAALPSGPIERERDLFDSARSSLGARPQTWKAVAAYPGTILPTALAPSAMRSTRHPAPPARRLSVSRRPHTISQTVPGSVSAQMHAHLSPAPARSGGASQRVDAESSVMSSSDAARAPSLAASDQVPSTFGLPGDSAPAPSTFAPPGAAAGENRVESLGHWYTATAVDLPMGGDASGLGAASMFAGSSASPEPSMHLDSVFHRSPAGPAQLAPSALGGGLFAGGDPMQPEPGLAVFSGSNVTNVTSAPFLSALSGDTFSAIPSRPAPPAIQSPLEALKSWLWHDAGSSWHELLSTWEVRAMTGGAGASAEFRRALQFFNDDLLEMLWTAMDLLLSGFQSSVEWAMNDYVDAADENALETGHVMLAAMTLEFVMCWDVTECLMGQPLQQQLLSNSKPFKLPIQPDTGKVLSADLTDQEKLSHYESLVRTLSTRQEARDAVWVVDLVSKMRPNWSADTLLERLLLIVTHARKKDSANFPRHVDCVLRTLRRFVNVQDNLSVFLFSRHAEDGKDFLVVFEPYDGRWRAPAIGYHVLCVLMHIVEVSYALLEQTLQHAATRPSNQAVMKCVQDVTDFYASIGELASSICQQIARRNLSERKPVDLATRALPDNVVWKEMMIQTHTRLFKVQESGVNGTRPSDDFSAPKQRAHCMHCLPKLLSDTKGPANWRERDEVLKSATDRIHDMLRQLVYAETTAVGELLKATWLFLSVPKESAKLHDPKQHIDVTEARHVDVARWIREFKKIRHAGGLRLETLLVNLQYLIDYLGGIMRLHNSWYGDTGCQAARKGRQAAEKQPNQCAVIYHVMDDFVVFCYFLYQILSAYFKTKVMYNPDIKLFKEIPGPERGTARGFTKGTLERLQLLTSNVNGLITVLFEAQRSAACNQSEVTSSCDHLASANSNELYGQGPLPFCSTADGYLPILHKLASLQVDLLGNINRLLSKANPREPSVSVPGAVLPSAGLSTASQLSASVLDLSVREQQDEPELRDLDVYCQQRHLYDPRNLESVLEHLNVHPEYPMRKHSSIGYGFCSLLKLSGLDSFMVWLKEYSQDQRNKAQLERENLIVETFCNERNSLVAIQNLMFQEASERCRRGNGDACSSSNSVEMYTLWEHSNIVAYYLSHYPLPLAMEVQYQLNKTLGPNEKRQVPPITILQLVLQHCQNDTLQSLLDFATHKPPIQTGTIAHHTALVGYTKGVPGADLFSKDAPAALTCLPFGGAAAAADPDAVVRPSEAFLRSLIPRADAASDVDTLARGAGPRPGSAPDLFVSTAGVFAEPVVFPSRARHSAGGAMDLPVLTLLTCSMRWTLQLMLQIAKAVALCHQAGFAHYDVRLPNIMFDKYGRIKLLDFGEAAFASSQGERNPVASLAFNAPEQRTKELEPLPLAGLLRRDVHPLSILERGKAIDIWQMGVVFWELIALVDSTQALLTATRTSSHFGKARATMRDLWKTLLAAGDRGADAHLQDAARRFDVPPSDQYRLADMLLPLPDVDFVRPAIFTDTDDGIADRGRWRNSDGDAPGGWQRLRSLLSSMLDMRPHERPTAKSVVQDLHNLLLDYPELL